VKRITAKVTKRIRSRPGSGSPASVVSGSASAAARETAPRIPDQAATTRSRQLARRSRCCGRRSRARMIPVTPKLQASRVTITSAVTRAVTRAPSAIASPALIPEDFSPSTITGSCRPIRMKRVALRRKTRISQTAKDCRRTVGVTSSGDRQPR
jgi:hypothetical protein